MTLQQAITAIEAKYSKKVTAIQYEDGSMTKFNYQLEFGPWKFVALKK